MATDERRPIALCAAAMHGLGMHLGAWAARPGPASDYVSPELYQDIARIAEQAKLHAVFFADSLTITETGVERPRGALDPVVLLAMMSAVTERLGLVATASTIYDDPYSLARRFGTLDHISHGRVGWNAVTSVDSLPSITVDRTSRWQGPCRSRKARRAGPSSSRPAPRSRGAS
jgi:alkanesulfonate monooxygenase SsuD/methylene tetrahydromethanopterin reductase-like flavin-dependent oxidoreductase (luciferase family)